MKQAKDFIDISRTLFNTNKNIALHEPCFIGNEKKYLNEAIDSTYVSSSGKYLDLIEKNISNKLGFKKCIPIVNGTSALYISLRSIGVKAGDEVITQALTFVATGNAIKHNNADPIFLDVDIDTMGLSYNSLKNFLENNCYVENEICYNKLSKKKIAACVPMHTFGFLCDIQKIVEICNKYHIPVIEDSAEAFGSFYNNNSAGSFGKLGVFSFNGNKVITSGGGGAIVSNDVKLLNDINHVIRTAKKKHPWEFFHDKIGFNLRMPNINAALLAAQLENFNEFISLKKNLFESYKRELNKIGLIVNDPPMSNTKWNYWLTSITMDNKDQRNSFLKYTNENGVFTRPIWTLLFKLPMFEDCYRDSQKNAIFLEERIVNIPSSAKKL